MTQLSKATLDCVDKMFAQNDQASAESVLEHECRSNLPFLEKADPVALERYRFAALKLSNGNLSELRRAVELAKQDWRDLLVAAEFAEDPKAHLSWRPPNGIA